MPCYKRRMSERFNGHRTGLCLAGGGITGAMYEVGVLAALEDAFEDFSVRDFDVFVGASSGACVATGLAAGLDALRMYRALLDPSDDFFPLQRQHLLKIDPREAKRVRNSLFGAARRMLGSFSSKPLKTDLWEELERFSDSLPAGLFSTETFEQFFFDVLTRRGLPKSFAEMPSKLFLVANDLDAGSRVVFGRAELANVPVAKAVAASMAAPMLFAPVRIDGRDFIAGGVGEAGHVDVAVEEGCDTVIVVNAMVPVRADPMGRQVPTGHGARRRVRDKGMLWVYNQSWRLVTEARLQTGLERYAAAHQDVDIQLIEPDRRNTTMFMHNPMNFAARRTLLEDGYTNTLDELRNPTSGLRQAFARLGLEPKLDEFA